MASSTQKDERKAEIVRRHRAGETGAEIARTIGVSRQYVHAFLKRVEAEGEDSALRQRRRGRTKDRPLTANERRALVEHLQAGQMPAGGAAQPGLTARAVTVWFKEAFGHTLTVHQLRRVCTDEGLKLALPAGERSRAPETPTGPEVTGATPPVAVPRRKRGRPRKDEAVRTDPDRLSSDALAAMERSNAQVAERLAAERKARIPPPAKNPAPKIHRNAPCPYDPKKKFKRCCGAQGAKWCLRQAEESPSSSSTRS